MTMANKVNVELTLQSTESTSRVPRNDSNRSILSTENSRSGCSDQRIFISEMDVINHILIVGVTVFLVYYAAKENHVTNIHVILCTIGYVLLMSEAIVVLAGDNFLTSCLSRRANKHLHWILQAIGLIFNLVGVGLMYDAKTTHFKSIHGILGIASLVIVCVVTIFGYPVWIAWKLRNFVRPVTIKLLHNFLGTAGFVIGMASQCYGYKKRTIYQMTKMESADDILLVLTVLIVILSERGALVSFIRQTVSCLKLLCSSRS
ncbi:transmembrane reductase CYB561D2 [Anoplolepis gracilipes]|uniref:transmembrane reductase CYB561D2 n=1 Tax=Anoplolepis gracilipes TaxID=354296 RepID=UPI003BA0C7F9